MRYPLVGLFLFILPGCDLAPSQTETAGIRIDTINGVVTHTVSGHPPRWSLDSLFALGGENSLGGQTFGDIRSIAVDRNGNVYAADALNEEIVVFSPSGARIRTIGRKGAGPGEFSRLGSISVMGDTLIVFDAANLRLGLFNLDGSWAGQWPVRPASGLLTSAGYHDVWVRTVRWNGPEYDHVFIRHDHSGARDTVPFRLASAPTDDPGNAIDCEMGDGSIALFTTAPAFRPMSVIRPTGDRLIAESAPMGYTVVLSTLSGDTVRVLKYETPDTAVTDIEWAAEAKRWNDFIREHPGGRCTGAAQRPSRKRLVNDIATDDDGNLWITRATTADAAADRIDVMDPKGLLLGYVSTPRHDIAVTRAGYLYVVTLDSLGIETLVGYRVGKR